MKKILFATAMLLGTCTVKAKTLIAYYSFTGNCKSIVTELESQITADVLEIQPAEEGLDYEANGYALGSTLISAIKANPNAESSYPAIKETNTDLSQYSTVIIVTPLWWSQMAAPMQTFLFKYGDSLKGKHIGLVVSSWSSGISGVESDAHRLIPDGSFMNESLWINHSKLPKRKTLIEEWLQAVGYANIAKEESTPKVYFTKEITAESLLKIYEALGVTPTGNVAVKISTGESMQTGYLRPDFIKPLVDKVNGTIVECNTAYGGNRSTTASHRKAIEERGFTEAAGFRKVDIMDEEGNLDIPVQDTKYITRDIVGSHLANYDWMINLAHFKGHAMGGFGGVLKNQSIGVASKSGKCNIHSAGKSTTSPWGNSNQDSFLESMAAAAQAVHNYLNGHVLYIDVMNKLSVDCDCDGSPSAPEMNDVGILASLDPVALDKACLDIVFNYDNKTGDDATALQNRINSLHGTHIVDYAEQIGLGSCTYTIIDLDAPSGISPSKTVTSAKEIRKRMTKDHRIVIDSNYDVSGKRINNSPQE